RRGKSRRPPRRAMRESVPMRDADLAEMTAALQVSVRIDEFVEAEDPIDDGLDTMLFDRAAHRFEGVAVADRDALQAHRAGDDLADRASDAGAAEHADHRDRAARADATQRLGQGPLAADLDDLVEAATAGRVARRLRPV